jgi:hypothetical protein
MCSNSTNILTVLANFHGIQNSIFSKNIGPDWGNTKSNSELVGDKDTNLDAPLPPWAITFEIDVDIDITLHTLCNMVAMDHSVKQSAAPQTSTRLHNAWEKTSVQPDWDW